MKKRVSISAVFYLYFIGCLGISAAAPQPPYYFTWFPSNDSFQRWDSIGDNVQLGVFLPRNTDVSKVENLHTSIMDSIDPSLLRKSPASEPRLWELAACSASDPEQKIRLPYPAPSYQNGNFTDGPHLFWVGWNGPFPDASHLKKLSQLGEGTFLCALLADGIRCSNVVKVTIRSDYDPTREPVVRVTAIQPLRGKEIQQVGIWIVPSTPKDRSLTNQVAAFAQLEVNGSPYGGSRMAWDGPVEPLPAGIPFPVVILWNASPPLMPKLDKAHVRAKLVDREKEYLSEEVEVLNDGTTDRFDRIFEQ